MRYKERAEEGDRRCKVKERGLKKERGDIKRKREGRRRREEI